MARSIEQRFVAWCLRADPAREALYGDLCEEFTGGRSRAWLWWQLCCAVATGGGRRIWRGKRDIAERWALGGAMLAVLLFAGWVTLSLGELLVDLVSVRLSASVQTDRIPLAAVAEEPIGAVLAALSSRRIVALTAPHGNIPVQAFLLSLIRDPRFAAAVNDIVIETASARYQDAIDRFVRGDTVPYHVLRKAWEEHTVANSGLSGQTEELLREVRRINASLGDGSRLRVIAGDPPIDWDNLVSAQDHRHWIELRDSYPADLIRRQVLDRGRRALVLYGQGHLQRRQIASNYDMSMWQAQTLVSLLEHDDGVRVFNIWTLLGRDGEWPDGVASWRAPGLATLHGTTLGARDFSVFAGGLVNGARFAVRDGQLVPLARTDWKTMRMEEEFDALLYLGPPASMTEVTILPALCRDSVFVATRLRRLERFGPPPEVDRFKRACGW